MVLRQAAKEVFDLPGDVHRPGEYKVGDLMLREAHVVARNTYDDMQAALREQGIEYVRLHRGVRNAYAEAGPLEPWTTDRTVADRFAGPGGIVFES